MLFFIAFLATADAAAPMSASARYRSMWVPDSFMDRWYFSDEPGTLAPRPGVRAAAYGLEFVLEPDQSVFQFYAEYISFNMDAGYWDGVEDPADYTDGDWVEPEGLGLAVLGVNLGREFAITSDDKKVWVGVIPSGGLGVGVSTGSMNRWKYGESDDVPDDACMKGELALDRKDGCPYDDTVDIWPVVPMLDVTAGLRVHLLDHGLIRFDVGFHDMLFWSATFGRTF